MRTLSRHLLLKPRSIVSVLILLALCCVGADAAQPKKENIAGGELSVFPRDKAVDVMAYGAKCDGQTDDTAAIQGAIGAAAGGGMVVFPPKRRCRVTQLSIVKVNGLVLSGAAAKEVTKASPEPTGIEFTGRPGACADGNGGLLRIAHSYNVLIQGLGLFEAVSGTPDDCFINVDASGRVRFVRDHISSPPSGQINTTAFLIQDLAQFEMIQSTIDPGFGRSVFGPPIHGNDLNMLRFIADRFSEQSLAYAYNYEVELSSPKSCDISDDAFEVGPNNLKITNGLGVKISTNWVGDGRATVKWEPGMEVRNRCVTPSNYEAHPAVFCTASTGRTGSSEPSWQMTPGSRTQDGAIEWINEGPGVSFNLAMVGEVSSNFLENPGAGNMEIRPNGGSGPLISGNMFRRGLWWNLRDLASGTSIASNNFTAYPEWPSLAGMLVVGDGKTNVASVDIRGNSFSSTSKNPTPYVHLRRNSQGVIQYDSQRWGSGKLVNAGGWRVH